ncbi:hypothetical protein BDR06DRAFT_852815, partial [Suillus hirtellus]
LQAFSNPGDSLGYADKCISSEIITEVFSDFCAGTRQKESEMYLKTLSAICGSLDNTFKAASKETLINKDRQRSKEPKGGILSVQNEDNLIIAAVAADIMGTILKKHAERGQPAEYWDRVEQERRLVIAFDKWADKGVWSATAQKVHQEQLKHVRKGCLEHNTKDIRADGSRIEGSHKGWNSLRRAQPSGVTMLNALGHDFVLRRNVRVAFSRSDVTPFIKFTRGSHHLQLCNYIAKLHNTLQQK